MAKKKIASKVIIASTPEFSTMIDNAYSTSVELKNLDFKDKAFKAELTKEAVASRAPGENVTVEFKGTQATAVIGLAEKYELDVRKPEFVKVREIMDKTMVLQDIIESTSTLALADADIVKAAALLTAAGIKCSVMQEFSVVAEAYRDATEQQQSSPQLADAMTALTACVERKESYRVSFSKNDK